MEKGRGKGTDTLQTDKVFTRKEYIEREAALRECQYDADGYVTQGIKAIPAADVAPVRHGRWIELENRDCKCSLCGCYHHSWEAHGYYCQHCGARMDVPDTDVGEMDGDGDV